MRPNLKFFAGVLMICALVLSYPLQTNAVAQAQTTTCSDDPERSGTLTFNGTTAAAFIVGYRWGTGVLTLENGQQFPFAARGLKVGEPGMSAGEIEGVVYGLNEIDDFIGHYVGSVAGNISLIGVGNIVLVNSECVTIVAKHLSVGLALSPSEEQRVTIQFASD